MARVPTAADVGQIRQARDPGVRNITPEAFGADVGSALKGFGKSIDEFGGSLGKFLEKKEKEKREKEEKEEKENRKKQNGKGKKTSGTNKTSQNDLKRKIFAGDLERKENARQIAGDKVAEVKFTSELRKQALSLFDEAKAGASDKPEGFASELAARLRTDVRSNIEQLPKRLRDRAEIQAEPILETIGVRARVFEHNALIRATTSDINDTLTDQSRQAFRQPAAADGLFESGVELLDSEEAALFLPARERQRMAEKLRRDLYTNAARGMPPEARLEVLRAGQFDDRLRDEELVQTLIREAENEAERERRLAETRAITGATAAIDALEAGRTAPDLAVARLRLEELDTDDSRAALATLGEAAEDAPELREFGLAPLAEQRARIDELAAAQELTPRRQRRLGRLRRAHGRLAQGLATAPFETALERGVIDAVTPLDFDDPASMAARTAEAETIAAAYGVAVSPLRPAEARALEARLDSTVPEALPDALADLRAGFGDAAMAEIARRFETDRPHLAVALRLAKQSPDLAADILQGGRRLKQALADGKAETLRPTDNELRAASTRVYGSPTAAQTRTAEVEAATALYALRVADATKPGFQTAVFDQAMRDVAPAGTLIDDFGMLGVPAIDPNRLDAVDTSGAPEAPAPSFLNVETHPGLQEASVILENIRQLRDTAQRNALAAQERRAAGHQATTADEQATIEPEVDPIDELNAVLAKANVGLARGLGALVDLANLPFQGLEALTGLNVASDRPLGGSESLMAGLRTLGVPIDKKPQTAIGRLAGSIAEETFGLFGAGPAAITGGRLGARAGEAGVAALRRQARTPSLPEEPLITRNRRKGKEFELTAKPEVDEIVSDAKPEITYELKSGIKPRADYMGFDRVTGEVRVIEVKSSDDAPLRPFQKAAERELPESGAVVVGKGKPPFVGGAQVDKRDLIVIRPKDLKPDKKE